MKCVSLALIPLLAATFIQAAHAQSQDKPKDDTPKGDEEGSAKGDAGKTEKKERVKRGPSLYNKFMASELPTFKAKLENKAMTHNEAFGTVSTMVRHAARALPSVLGCRRERPGRAAGLG